MPVYWSAAVTANHQVVSAASTVNFQVFQYFWHCQLSSLPMLLVLPDPSLTVLLKFTHVAGMIQCPFPSLSVLLLLHIVKFVHAPGTFQKPFPS